LRHGFFLKLAWKWVKKEEEEEEEEEEEMVK
jgi:hypothetical protein